MKFTTCHICAVCGGEGHVIDGMTGNDVPCDTCHGTGRICEDSEW
jgi:DnaJ-class molecular chaperone